MALADKVISFWRIKSHQPLMVIAERFPDMSTSPQFVHVEQCSSCSIPFSYDQKKGERERDREKEKEKICEVV